MKVHPQQHNAANARGIIAWTGHQTSIRNQNWHNLLLGFFVSCYWGNTTSSNCWWYPTGSSDVLHLAQTGIGGPHGAEKPKSGTAPILLLTVFKDFLARLFLFKCSSKKHWFSYVKCRTRAKPCIFPLQDKQETYLCPVHTLSHTSITTTNTM